MPREIENGRATGLSLVSYQPVAAFASARAVPTALNASSVSRINCSTFADRSSMKGSEMYLMLCVGVLSLSNSGSANMSGSSRGVIVRNGLRVCALNSRLRLDDRGRLSGKMRRHDFESSDELSGIPEGR